VQVFGLGARFVGIPGVEVIDGLELVDLGYLFLSEGILPMLFDEIL
jgi:hypothetical protein